MKTELEIAKENIKECIESKGRIILDFDDNCNQHLSTLKKWLEFLVKTNPKVNTTSAEAHKIFDLNEAIAHYKENGIE